MIRHKYNGEKGVTLSAVGSHMNERNSLIRKLNTTAVFNKDPSIRWYQPMQHSSTVQWLAQTSALRDLSISFQLKQPIFSLDISRF